MTTPILSLAEMEEAQANPHLIFNEGVRALEAALGRGFTTIVTSDAEDYLLTSADDGRYIRRSRATAQTVTVPEGLPEDFTVHIRQAGAGPLTIVESSGVTVNALALELTGIESVVSLIRVAANEFDLIGDVTAAVSSA